MREGGLRLAPEQERARRILCRRRGQQVTSPHDQVDALATIVDDDSEPVRPVAVAIDDRQVPVCADLLGARADQGDHPPLGTAAQGRSEDGPVDAARAATAGAAGAVPGSTVVLGPGLERRP